MDESLAFSLSHVTEMGAMAAARAAGYGDKNGADHAAVKAMRSALNNLEFNGRIVIGEGERDQAPMLYIGEQVGSGQGRAIDIAVDPLENTNATATLGPRAISVLAAAEQGGLFHAPDMYMEKLVVPPEAADRVNLDDPIPTTLKTLAKVLDREVADLVIVILDRKRHTDLVAQVRTAGARVKLVPDGDLLPGIAACMRGTNIHAVMGIGAAPEGVMTAAAMRCLGGSMQARFWPKNQAEEKRLVKMGGQLKKIYTHQDLASGQELVFCATGVTTGELLNGVRFFGGGARTHTLLITNQSGKIRFVDTTQTLGQQSMRFRV